MQIYIKDLTGGQISLRSVCRKNSSHPVGDDAGDNVGGGGDLEGLHRPRHGLHGLGDIRYNIYVTMPGTMLEVEVTWRVSTVLDTVSTVSVI